MMTDLVVGCSWYVGCSDKLIVLGVDVFVRVMGFVFDARVSTDK